MKKARIIATAITAASLVISCAALVACTDPVDPDKSYDITFDANGGAYADGTTTVIKTDENGRVAAKPNDPVWAEHLFASYNTAEDGTGTEITFGASGYQFSADTTVYAQWTEIREYTVTFDANGGTLPEGVSNTATTVSGKITSFPTLTVNDGLSFGGWYTAATGGTMVTSSTVISADMTVYAHWVEAGLYTADGKFVAELEKSTPTDTAIIQFGASGVELAPGDVLKIIIRGLPLTHTEELGLWTDGGCHGINFDQSAATFTVKDGNERLFDVYAKYYTDGNPCWSIYMSDGLTDADLLVEGGAYLCGQGWTHSDWNNAVPENYIDPENGLTITFSADAQFKIAQCVNGAREWNYNNSSLYTMAEGKEEGYLNLAVSATANGTVLAAGEYTITVVGEGDNVKFVFTPGKDVQPAELENKYVAGGFYLAGADFSNDGGNAEWTVNEHFYIDPENGLTVTFKKNATFQVIGSGSSTTANPIWTYDAASYYKMADGAEEGYITISASGNKTVITAGTYTVTIEGEGADVKFVFTPEEGLQPDTTVQVLHYYIKGNVVTGWANKAEAKYELVETAEGSKIYELNIELTAGDEVMFVSFAEGADGNVIVQQVDYFNNGNTTLTDAGNCLDSNSTNYKTVEAGIYTFTLDLNGDKPALNVTFSASAAE
ncbi:MAG: InlB B-repeat-containing protein [Clostridia bacterium]|nr:InlB B-repeat-containing protein [Clostridia bacterium]